ncbi:MAG: helicase [Leptolyngbya sp.]|nr:MAG: helicase [Leptolyngbya sp.]
MTKIYHADLWGSREDKYRYLLEHDITTVEWTELAPASPAYLFIPQNIDCKAEYEEGWKITEIMPVNSVGLYTARDELAIQWTKDELKEVLGDFSSLSSEIARSKYALGEDSRDWQVTLAQKDIQSSGLDNSKIQLISYRPFDARFTYYTGKSRGFICMPRPSVMYHVLQKDNLGINVCRQIISESWSHIFASNLITDNCYVSNKSRERNYLFSLYTYPDTANQQSSLFVEKSPNFSSGFLNAIREKFGYIPTPEAIFYYIYAIFHSPTYRDRYAEFLKGDFPRVPLTSSDQLFKNLGAKGQALVDLHLMKSKNLNKLITKMGGDGDNAVTEVTYKPTEQRVYINSDRYFEGIAPEVWKFKIGGYQVLDKWLKDRKKAKRTLSFDDGLHYQKVVVALAETMQLMEEIDQLIPGFPII